MGFNTSVGGALEHDLHRKRREALNPFFSHSKVARLAPQLAQKVEQVETWFSKVSQTGEIINLSDVYFALASE
jgi:cytochrome P450